MPSLIRKLSLAVTSLGLGFAAFVLVSRTTDLLGIRRNVVFPAITTAAVPAYPNGELVRHHSGGRTAGGYLVESKGRLVVYFHGNRSTIGDDRAFVSRLVEAGFAVLLVEYPGYGISAHEEASEQAVYADSRALIRHLQETRGHGPDETILVGYSLGAAVAAQMAVERHGTRLLLLAPFTSTVDIGARSSPRFLVALFTVDRLDTLSKAAGIRMPVLIVHGAKDQVVPLAMGQRLDGALPGSSLIVVPEAGHDVIRYAARGALWERVRSFLEAQADSR